MGRRIGLEFSVAYFHVVNRGVERRAVFSDHPDARAFLNLAERLYPRFHVALHA